MSDVEAILELLKERSSSLNAWAWAYASSAYDSKGGAECKARAEAFRSESRMLNRLVREIEDAIAPAVGDATPPGPAGDRRRVVITEMTGPMDVFILPDPSIETIHGRTVEDHEMLLDPGEGRLSLGWVVVPPRSPATDGVSAPLVDMRYALITYLDGGFSAEIHNTLAEAEAAMDLFAKQHDAGVVDYNNSIALCTVRPVLIPRRELAARTAPYIDRA